MSEEWRWIPVSESPGEEPRKICVLKDGEKDVYWWTDILGFEEDVTHWCEVRYPPLPEPPKPDIQVVCEWLWPGRDRAGEFCSLTIAQERMLLWDIETELIPKSYNGLTWEHNGRPGGFFSLHADTSLNGVRRDGRTRGEVLIAIALWLKDQEG